MDNANHSLLVSVAMNLSDLKKDTNARVLAVMDTYQNDPIAHRMRELGFIAGASVRVVTRSFLGGHTLVVHLGNTRFALRKHEAQRVMLETPA